MSKSRRKKPKSQPITGQVKSSRKQSVWRQRLRGFFIAVFAVSLFGVAIASYKHNYDIEHDLSVIGTGLPTVVQIHDPGCRLCRQLRNNTDDAMRGLDEQLIYRIADITTTDGRRLQRKYDVEHVTLLLFDGAGELRNVLTGVRDEDSLRRSFEHHIRVSSKTE